MSTRELSSSEALKVAFRNKFKRWVPAVEKEIGDKATAMARFGDEYFHVEPETSFSIKNTDRVFTVGSCFARNVESALVKNKIDVIGHDFSLASEVLQSTVGAMKNKVNARSVLNKYSTLSICAEFERVLKKKKVKDNGFIELADNQWVDPQLAAVLKPMPFKDLNVIRDSVDKLISEVVDADVVFVTLGLNEVWFDNITNTYLNSSPPPSMMRSSNSRFVFSTPTFEIVYENLSRFVNLVREYSTKDVKFVVTVSPVPMSTTWTKSDIVVANTISKSTLRVCADRLASDFDVVDYFPSFEIVTNSPKATAWQSDKLHVTQPMVDFIISNFVASYFTEQLQ